MFSYTPNSTWHSTISNFDTTDVVQGGPSGVDNVPIRELADNDQFLYDLRGRFENITNFNNNTSSGVFSPTVSQLNRKILRFYCSTSSNYGTINLPDATTFPAYAIIEILVVGDVDVPVKITAAVSQNIYTKLGFGNEIYMHLGERLRMYRNGSNWEVISCDGNMFNVGQQRYGYTQEPGTIIRNGQTYLRARYPRLWALINANPSLIIPEATWNTPGTAGFQYQGYFSDGDGSTTFRVPDDRGTFDRALDIYRGMDMDRHNSGNSVKAGSYQDDEIKSHKHTLNIPTASNTLGGSNVASAFGSALVNIPRDSVMTGGLETRPKNVGKYPLIVY